jgi:solute carrier family 25 iron transporter 28/37
VWQTEGFRAFYRSFVTQLTMNVPFQAIHFVMYEFGQDYMNKDRQYNPRTHMLSGACAGAVASAVTTPLDVCKTLLNTQESCAGQRKTTVNGLAQAIRTVYEFRGILGFFQGVSARVVYVMPGTAISWSVYEFFKYFITKRKHADSGYVTPSSSVQIHAVSSK